MAPLGSAGNTDPGWEHGVAQDEKKKKVKCNYCGKIVSGGIYRLKQHLAGIPGEVKCCRKAPKEVLLKMIENLGGCPVTKKRRLVVKEDEHIAFRTSDDDDDERGYVDYKWKAKEGAISQGVESSLIAIRSSGFGDPGWEHGVAQDDKRKKVKCNYCNKVVSGGINRFKQHLARIPGEVAFCKMAPEEVYLQMKENMKWHRTGWRRRPEDKEFAASVKLDNEELLNNANKPVQQVDDNNVCNSKQINNGGRSSFVGDFDIDQILKPSDSENSFPKTHKTNNQPKLRSSDLKVHKEIVSAISKFFYYAAVPFDVADSVYFHKMLDLVGRYGQGFKAPSGSEISGDLLQKEAAAIREQVVEVKASRNSTGCTVILENWKDVQERTHMNILVSCPRGIYCISSIDASDAIENVANLFELLDGVIEDLGEENVVQVITANTDCFRSAGKLLEEKRKCLFWTPCIAYCTNKILEDILKIKWIEECVLKGQKVTRFIYNNNWVLKLMREDFTAGRELLGQAATRFTASFVALQNLLRHRTDLRRMFQSSKWLSSQVAKSNDGKAVEKVVLNSTFWRKMQYINKSVEPVLNVMKKVESGEGLSMPSIYHIICQAKLAIKAIHGDEEQKYRPFWNAIDSHWSSLFCHPLYTAAYFLNPSFRYRPEFTALPEVIRGLNECITRLEPDNGRRVCAVTQISDFVLSKADFGTELALSTRAELDPATWWQQHGISCLELQRIAVRILSQTCISFGCEHRWSALDHLPCMRKKRMDQSRFSDIAFVHYNLRLRERQMKRVASNISLDNFFVESFLVGWVKAPDNAALTTDEVIQQNGDDQDVNGFEYFDKGKDSDMLVENVKTSEVQPGSGVAIKEVDDDADADLNLFDEDYGD